MKITWLGHAAFRVETAKAVILIDPFLNGNPGAKGIDFKGSHQGCHAYCAHPRPW